MKRQWLLEARASVLIIAAVAIACCQGCQQDAIAGPPALPDPNLGARVLELERQQEDLVHLLGDLSHYLNSVEARLDALDGGSE